MDEQEELQVRQSVLKQNLKQNMRKYLLISTGLILIGGVFFFLYYTNFVSVFTPITTLDINYEESPFGMVPVMVDGDYSFARDIGVRWTQTLDPSFAWAVNQPDINTNAYHFKKVDQKGITRREDLLVADVINIGHLYGVFEHDTSIIESIYDTRFYSTNSNLFSISWKPKDPAKLGAYIKKTVERYDGDSDYGCVVPLPDCYVSGDNEYPSQEMIEAFKNSPIKNYVIGNEPIVALMKANVDTNYESYATIAIESIKSVCSDCKVLNGGFTAGLNNSDYTLWIDGYISILAKMGDVHFDIIDMHWYGTAMGDYRFIDNTNNLDIITYLRNKLVEIGYPPNVPIWITEMTTYSGTVSGGKYPDFPPQSEIQHAGDFLRRHIYPISRGVQKIFMMWGVMEGYSDEDGYMDHISLIYDGKGSNDLGYGVKKLSYYTYKLMTEKLEGSDWNSIQEVYNSNNIYAYRIIKNGEPVYVIWWDYWEDEGISSKTIKLSDLGISGTVQITEATPHFEDGLELENSGENYPEFFDVSTSSNEIVLDKSPIYVEKSFR